MWTLRTPVGGSVLNRFELMLGFWNQDEVWQS